MTTSTVHPKLDYAGGTFGRPEAALFSKSWRVKHGGRKDTVTATLLGQDSVGVSSLQPGYPVYAGYAYGPFNNWSALVARFPTAKLVSISPVVETSERVAVLDVEPGNATPANAPSFVKLGKAGIVNKPTIYCSAGDISAVVDACSNAGISRNSYYVWSAHWIGEHICGPATCGYPQADACQYASNNAYDSDVWTTSMFTSTPVPPPPPSPYPVKQGATGALVETLQTGLNKWAEPIGLKAKLVVDGNFGALTEAAVKLALVHFDYSAANVALGEAPQSLFDHLAAAVPPTPVPEPLAPLVVSGSAIVTTTYSVLVNRTIEGYKGTYVTDIRAVAPGTWVGASNTSSAGLVRLSVPKSGDYLIETSAAGYEKSSKTATVPES
jgi:hypothetical protein